MRTDSLKNQDHTADRAAYPYAISANSAEMGGFEISSFDNVTQRKFSLSAWLFGEFVVGPFFLLVTLGYTYLVPQALSNKGAAWDSFRHVFKRIVDIMVSIVGIFLALPLFTIVPILIKLNSSGPVFYTQVRVGQDRRARLRRSYRLTESDNRRRRERRREDYGGKLFKIVKFRSMVHNAERESGPVWASKNDPRVTGIGRFLRASRLDELPQLFSVLGGQMSMIGPRPERPVFVKEFESQVSGYHRRLSVKPGITGLAQVENGYDDSIASVTEKIKVDLNYIDDWSPWLDMKILLKTVRVVLTGRGAK